jgi:hypothetical protein
LVIKFITGNILTIGTADKLEEAYIFATNTAGRPEYLINDFPSPKPWDYNGTASGLITIFNKKILFYACDTGGPHDVPLYCNRTTRAQTVDYVGTFLGHLEPI